ncbi:MAG TPA: peptidoglycan-binding protein, partial [Ilumatobacteraceae bacterium]
FREYNEQLVAAAAESDGYLQVADWATYSLGASGWFEADGVHLTPRGVDVITTFIAGIVERVLAGENVSPDAAPWTVLVPGAEGDTVTAVQTALVDAGIDLRGGVDGVYGNDTMAAVAEYQRRHDSLQVTGAVDVATARLLGVYRGEAAAEPSTTAVERVTPAIESAADRDAVVNGTEAIAAIGDDEGHGVQLLIVAAAGLVVALTIVTRRRSESRERSARRWARVHPATSPGRSIADMRRAGELPGTSAGPSRIYDHALDDAAELRPMDDASSDIHAS